MPYRKTVSVEIGPDRIRAAELMNGRKHAEVFNVIEFDTPAGCVDNGYIVNPQTLGEQLGTYLRDAGITTEEAIFSVISDDILVGGAEIDRGRKKDILSRAREKAREIFGLAPSRQESPQSQEARDDDEPADDLSGQNPEEVRGAESDSVQSAEDSRMASIDDYYISYVEQQDSVSEWSMNLILYAAPVDLIDPYCVMADYANLNITNVDFSGNSIFQWMRRAFGSDSVMMVDLRRRGSTATILTEGVLRVQVDLASRTDSLMDAVKARDEAVGEDGFEEDTSAYVYGEARIVSESEALVEEVNSIASEFLSENLEEYIDTIVISTEGEGSLIVAREIARRTGIETLTVEDLPKGVQVKDRSVFGELNAGQYIGVIGAVIEPLQFRKMGQDSEIVRTSSKKDLVSRIMLIVVIVCLIATAVLCVTYFVLRSHNKALQSSLDKVKYIEDIYEDYQKAEQGNSEIRSLDKLTKDKNEVLSQLFTDLESRMPSDSKITSMNASDDMISFSVSAGGKQTAAQFIIQLKKIDYLSDITVSDLTDTKDSAGHTSVDFTVSAYLTGEVDKNPERSDGANDDGISSGNYSGSSNKDNEDEDSTDSSDTLGQSVSYRSQEA